MDYRILGPLEVLADGRPLPVGGTKRRAVLAALLLSANEVVSSDRLIDDLWGEQPPEGAANALQVHISGLRKTLEADDGRAPRARTLLTQAPGYVLHVAQDELDLFRFERLQSEARADLANGAPGRASAKLREALALWRGEPVDDLRFEPSLQLARARLEELRLAALEDRIEADLSADAQSDVVPELEALVAANPLRERLRAQLMLALYRSGRQAEALEAYRDTRRALVDELGIEPSRAVQELHAAILGQDPSLDAAAPAPERGSAPATAGRFVAREHELKQLGERLEAARSGRGSVTLIAGDPGIGKTRLADELGAVARERGFAVHWGRCWEAGGAPPYWPWVQALRSYVRGVDSARLRALLADGAADLAQLLPELASFVDVPTADRSPGESDGDRFRLFQSVAAFLAAAATDRPQLLVLDDLHAADAPSVLLLEFVAREARASRLLVVGTYRDVEVDETHPLRAAIVEIAREPGALTFALAGLSPADINRFVESVAQTTPPDELVADLFEQTDGNPLFVGEIVRLLASQGRLSAQAAAHGARPIPQTIRDVITGRVNRLSDDCTTVLATAAVIGRDFTIAVLERVAGRAPDELVDLLDEAQRVRVAGDDPASPGRYRFAHALIRDTLYEALPASRRLQLHREVGEALEALYPGEAEHLAELAHHFLAAAPLGDSVRAIDYARRAGDRALGILAFEEAARHYDAALRAMEAAGAADQAGRCTLLLALGEAHARAGAGDEAKLAFWRAAEVAEAADLPAGLARAALGYGGRFLWGRASMDQRLVPLLERALAALPPEDQRTRALVLGRLAGATRAGSDLLTGGSADADGEYSRARGREAVTIARELGDPDTLAYALEAYLHAVIGPGTVQERMELSREVVELSERTGDRERLAAGWENVFHSAWELGDVATADVAMERLTTLAAAMRQPAQLWLAQATRAKVALASGDLDEGERLIEDAFEYGSRAQSWNAEITYLHQMFMLRRAQGRLRELEPRLRQAVGEFPNYQLLPCLLASVEASLGDDEAARATLDALAPDDFRKVSRDDTWMVAMAMLAEACHAVGATDHAPTLYRLLAPYANLIASVPPDVSVGSVARLLGLLALTNGDVEAARAHFEHALDVNERTGGVVALAETRRDAERLAAV